MLVRPAYVNDIFKKVSECVCKYCCDISWPFGLYSINFFSYEDSRKHKRGPPMTLNKQMKEISKYPSD